MTDQLDIKPSPNFNIRPARQILVLHGGGFRGLYTARVLELLEAETGHRIANSFDLIAGTSIGGIIALALAEGLPAKRIRKTIEEEGPKLFPAYGWFRRKAQLIQRVFAPPHQQALLRVLIGKVLSSDKPLQDLSVQIVVPACDATGNANGPAAVIYGNHKSNQNRTARLEDVALATSAAPTYFESYQSAGDSRQLVDGGVIANSPSWIAMTIALADYGWEIDYLRMLIIGTTQSPLGRVPKSTQEIQGWARLRHPIQWYKGRSSEGFLYWLRKGRLLSLLMDGQQRLADHMCTEAMNRNYCLSINSFRSPEQDKVAASLNQASNKAADTLMSLADRAAQSAIQDNQIMQMLNRRAERLRE